MINQTPIGADCRIKEKNDPVVKHYRIAFGEYDDSKLESEQNLNFPDDTVYFYVKDENELKKRMKKENHEDFYILSYTLIYKE